MTLRKTGIRMLCVMGMLLWLAPAAVCADDSPTGRWWTNPAMAEKLDLTAQEKQVLETLFTQNRKTLFDLKSEVEKQRFVLENVMEAENFDQRAAIAQHKKLEDKRKKLGAERFRYLLEVRKILGRDRYLKLMAMAREHRGRRSLSSSDEIPPR